ncbi:MAG: hypothetical protein HOP29_02690 [Phycisphaerales bacterium]|nr:hypothetical protein [Phycisphaerales bacterium]
MIPRFNETGYLPPGVHRATIEEIEARFGRRSEVRRAQMDSVRWMVELAVRAGVERIVLNGSFVTDIMEPNDVDCVLLVRADSLKDPAAEDALFQGLPFLEVALVRPEEFNYFVNRFFAFDRDREAKGMVEVTL